ncbi:NYN domain-containing protein [Nocardioides gilvus]|uniref:NYN domain-containing protein n=1 Tax=Nocardioides gilvus TaxID=1735589 RepID=UPI000D7493F3|nr:NYN domain-containing protein [Nocardioides gilvus]
MQETPSPSLSELPEEVRTRLATVVAEVLPSVGSLPVGLRKVAAFDSRRRARLGRGAVLTALEDEEFRSAAAVQVADARPDWAAQPDALAPVDRTAAAWLLQADGWQSAVAEHLITVSAAGEASRERELEQVRGQLARAQEGARVAAEEHRAQMEKLRAENALVRQRLGEARAQVRALDQQVRETVGDREEAVSSTRAELTRVEKELRQLRAQAAQLAAGSAAEQRARKRMRADESVRARVLLETLLDAAVGLRRELALPPVAGLPADAVDERHRVSDSDALPTGVGGVPESQVLPHVLAMPRARLLVDGYNVSKSAWPDSTLEAQRIRLLGLLAPLVAQSGVETTVVFDGQGSTHRPPVNAPRGIKVAFSPHGVIADDVLADYVEAEPEGRVVVLVTSDQALAGRARRLGARVVGSTTLVELLAR